MFFKVAHKSKEFIVFDDLCCFIQYLFVAIYTIFEQNTSTKTVYKFVEGTFTIIPEKTGRRSPWQKYGNFQ